MLPWPFSSLTHPEETGKDLPGALLACGIIVVGTCACTIGAVALIGTLFGTANRPVKTGPVGGPESAPVRPVIEWPSCRTPHPPSHPAPHLKPLPPPLCFSTHHLLLIISSCTRCAARRKRIERAEPAPSTAPWRLLTLRCRAPLLHAGAPAQRGSPLRAAARRTGAGSRATGASRGGSAVARRLPRWLGPFWSSLCATWKSGGGQGTQSTALLTVTVP